MKSLIKCIAFSLVLWGVFFLDQSIYAQDSAIEKVGDFGSIDWIAQQVVAQGTGASPSKYIGTPQARPLALRAAITDARRNLLEVVKGVYIDSTTQVENYMVKDEKIVSRVEGVLKNAPVEKYQYLSDGTVEAVVSMPLTGQMGEILIGMTVAAQNKMAAGIPPQGEWSKRLYLLEKRVKALEEKLDRINKINTDQDQLIRLLKEVVQIWTAYSEASPLVVNADYATERKLLYLKRKLDEQDVRLKDLSTRLDDLANRLSAEKSLAVKTPPKPTPAPKPAVMYTGLVIDARQTDFRPCLKPEVYSQGQLVYPGENINMRLAVHGGIVRYYRDLGRAQQNDRIGIRPCTIKAKGTWKGRRSLEIDPESYQMLRPFVEMPESFMSDCKVVIVF
jgi:hypothetical protein